MHEFIVQIVQKSGAAQAAPAAPLPMALNFSVVAWHCAMLLVLVHVEFDYPFLIVLVKSLSI